MQLPSSAAGTTISRRSEEVIAPCVEKGANYVGTSGRRVCALCGRHGMDTPRNRSHSRFGNERPGQVGGYWISGCRSGLGVFCVGCQTPPKRHDRGKLKGLAWLTRSGSARHRSSLPLRARRITDRESSWPRTARLCSTLDVRLAGQKGERWRVNRRQNPTQRARHISVGRVQYGVQNCWLSSTPPGRRAIGSAARSLQGGCRSAPSRAGRGAGALA